MGISLYKSEIKLRLFLTAEFIPRSDAQVCWTIQVAKHFSLKMNEVNFYEPFMEEPSILPGRPLSEMDIVDFVNQHRK